MKCHWRKKTLQCDHDGSFLIVWQLACTHYIIMVMREERLSISSLSFHVQKIAFPLQNHFPHHLIYFPYTVNVQAEKSLSWYKLITNLFQASVISRATRLASTLKPWLKSHTPLTLKRTCCLGHGVPEAEAWETKFANHLPGLQKFKIYIYHGFFPVG